MERHAIGLVGWGVVGGGVVEILSRDAAIFRERCGLDLALARIIDPHPGRPRPTPPPPGTLVGDRLEELLQDEDVPTVIHLVPGTGAAKEVMVALLQAGKNVITANKALLAEHGDELFDLAHRRGVAIAFEAAVAGGVPVIAALRDGFVANRIEAIYAILNGTCNFILTKMDQEGMGYQEALGIAQRLGYAESDPTLDVDGTDTAHKLAILSRIALGARVPLRAVRKEGIQSLTFDDIASAQRLGCRIKLIACARRVAQGIDLHVAPTLVPLDHPLAAVNQNYNGVYIVGNYAGPNLLVGQGAGALPTASAVLADVVDVASGRYHHTANRFRFFSSQETVAALDEQDEETGSYARFTVTDRPGVLAGITNLLSSHGASILNIHQGLPAATGVATIEVTTHPMRGGHFLAAVRAIDAAGLTTRPTTSLRRL